MSGVQELVERMKAGDPAATREVGRRLAEGDNDVALELRRRMAAFVGGDEPPEDPDVFQADLRAVNDRNTSNPGTTGSEIDELEVRARRLGTCPTAQVLSLRVRHLTLTGDLERACRELESARTAATRCRACQLETLRCEALLLLHQGDCDGALRISQQAMDGYESLGAGHDLNGNGWASSLIARAQIRFELGDRVGAAADFATALQHFRRGSKVWQVTHQNLAHTLALAGPAEKLRASRELTSLRLSMRRGVTVERAGFLWLDGQLIIAAGDGRRSRRERGLDRLYTSLRLYSHPTIATPGPWLGVGSDCTRVLFPDRKAIEKFLEKEMIPHAGRLIKADIHRRQLDELCALAGDYRTEASSLRCSIETLREAAGASMPCLLPPWPARVW
ncbi:MAG TPA: hypothetical protein VGG06_10330 [Thermoanaerobaculia bacterium]